MGKNRTNRCNPNLVRCITETASFQTYPILFSLLPIRNRQKFISFLVAHSCPSPSGGLTFHCLNSFSFTYFAPFPHPPTSLFIPSLSLSLSIPLCSVLFSSVLFSLNLFLHSQRVFSLFHRWFWSAIGTFFWVSFRFLFSCSLRLVELLMIRMW